MRRVRDVMTPSPHSVGPEQSVAVAARRMDELDVRHLPVLAGSALVGILSERDVRRAEVLEARGAPTVRVADVMVAEPYVVDGLDDLAIVARTMADRKIGSAIVTERGKVAGIFTATDALRALADRLEMSD